MTAVHLEKEESAILVLDFEDLSKKPLVTVVIPCHNYGRFLGEAIESVLAQTYKPIEVIVVDDGSTDDTKQIASRFPVVYHYIEHKGNFTPARAHNVGLKLGKGEFVVFLGADDVIAKEYIEKCYRTFTHHKLVERRKVGFVWTATQEFGNSWEMRFPRTKVLKRKRDCYQNPGGQLGAMLVSREAYKKVGGYDESLHGLEDWDWAIRACEKGYQGVSITEPEHYQRMHRQNLTLRVKKNGIVAELYRKYPTARLYSFFRRQFHRLELLLTKPRQLVFRARNRLASTLNIPKISEPPSNIQHSLVNEKRIIRYVRGTRVLDCGCGIGRWGFLLNHKHALIGIDIVTDYLKRAKHNGYLGVVRADISYIPFKNKAFDTALAVEVIEHLSKVSGIRFLEESRRVSKQVVLTTPKTFWSTAFPSGHPEGHASFWTRNEVLRILNAPI